MTKHEDIRLSDREMEPVRRYAEERGLTIEEAFTQLFKSAVEKKFRKGTGRGPAKVYSINRSKE